MHAVATPAEFERLLLEEKEAIQKPDVMTAIKQAVEETQRAYPYSNIGWQVRGRALEIHALYFRDSRAHFTVRYNDRRRSNQVVIEAGNYSRNTLMVAYNSLVKAMREMGPEEWDALERAVAAERQPGVRFDD